MIAEVTSQKIIQKKPYWDRDKKYSFDEYFKLEEKAPFKSEFHNGKIIPTADETIVHGMVIGSLFFHLRLASQNIKKNILVCSSGIKLFIKTINTGLYPNCSIIIGERETYKKNKAITNPTIIFEVLSDSTEDYDRGEKFRKYKMLPSFQEYVLIEQDQPVIDVFHKKENGAWEMNSYIDLEEEMKLNSLDIKIPLSNIYEDVENLLLPQYKMDL